MNLAELTWTCMICGDERPDAKISVEHRPVVGQEAAFPGTRWNVRYCNDRPACAAKAKLWPQSVADDCSHSPTGKHEWIVDERMGDAECLWCVAHARLTGGPRG